MQRIEPHCLKALVLEDLRHYPGSSSGEIHHRIAPEVPYMKIYRTLGQLVEEKRIRYEGDNRWRRYWASAGLP
ncbi:hypothetical protein [Oscillatoria sp. FACHB-1406]|uniref:hypothetical protein n=1 Tax=Oscillatoria sp. FACHB-1406 TaxID=2692846 RepID=UPI0016871B09|nr:hypothetical protein [Oscillatoria sp. FACHB-1406]MBD2576224.1 hypothetical protein [Oscillatoria sp. FACHB-1406]